MSQTKDDNFILRTNLVASTSAGQPGAYHGLDSPHVGANRLSDQLPAVYRLTGPIFSQTSGHADAGFHSSPAIVSTSPDSRVTPLNGSAVTLPSALVGSLPTVLHYPSMTSRPPGAQQEEHSVLNIEDVVHNLNSALEDYHGQYPVLQKLEELIKLTQKLIRVCFLLLNYCNYM